MKKIDEDYLVNNGWAIGTRGYIYKEFHLIKSEVDNYYVLYNRRTENDIEILRTNFIEVLESVIYNLK